MQIKSKIVNIPYVQNISTEYVEDALKRLRIVPLRWAIVKVEEDSFTISCAYQN